MRDCYVPPHAQMTLDCVGSEMCWPFAPATHERRRMGKAQLPAGASESQNGRSTTSTPAAMHRPNRQGLETAKGGTFELGCVAP